MLIHKTQDIYKKILAKINEVDGNVGLVYNKINEILNANNNIVECINEVSATSEQSTARTQEVNAMTQHNFEHVNLAKGLVEELIDTSKQMEKYFQKV